MSTTTSRDSLIEPSRHERKELERLNELLQKSGSFSVSAGEVRLKLSASALQALRAAVRGLLRGATSVVPLDHELTSQEAADLLSVSRQYLVRLVDGGSLHAVTTEGGHRRLKLEEVLRYRSKRDAERSKALEELEAETEEYGGYSHLKR